MQLDSTTIPVRERGYLDLLDLALRVGQSYPLPLLATFAAGIAPMMLLNHLFLSQWLIDWELASEPEALYAYLWRLAFLMVLEMPLAAAAATLFLGQVMFLEKLDLRAMQRDARAAAGQFLLYVLAPRAAFVLPAVFGTSPFLTGVCTLFLALSLLFYYARWPYLGEVVLLERNPWRKGKDQRMSTFGRASVLHNRSFGDLFGRWVTSLALGTAWAAALALLICYARGILANRWGLDGATFSVACQGAAWAVLSYFTVVRYLCYLDLRIRNEGWEIELRMRAEADRMTRRLA